MSDVFTTLYKPDVLSCLADLSNDEVFTPPSVVNDMLDMLPQELFESPDTTFLDPVCKSGVFLREIAKRLIKGLEGKIPDLQERIDHIFQKQLYGIAITELTSLLSRRSVYCSKYPNSKYSVSQFDDVQGNIRYKNVAHEWVKGKCCFCGATESEYGTQKRDGMESHAYEFIHTTKPQEIYNMKFDVIIGNPPYQLSTAGKDNGAQAIPLYHKFIIQSIKLRPRFLVMITPSRWFTGGFGLNNFRDTMLHDRHIREIHDYLDASDCFPGVEIKGGVNYFLWDSTHNGDTKITTYEDSKPISTAIRPLLEKGSDIFVRYNEAVSILHKVQTFNETSFATIVSKQRPFNIPTNFTNYATTEIKDGYKIYGNKFIGYLSPFFNITKGSEYIGKYKLFTPKAVGSGDGKSDLIKPIIGEPNAICTETYVVAGTYSTKKEAENAKTYINTKFFHFLLTLRKNTQDCLGKVFTYIPMQDFSKPWTDAELYAKYKLTREEIDFIESMIRPME